MKPSVLCITRNALSEQNIPSTNCHGLYPFSLTTVAANQFHFINRDVVDSHYPAHHEVGCTLPQILAYCLIHCEGKILTYSRNKGAETRLHGSRSIGFGGHVDIADYSEQSDEYVGYLGALIKACERELQEELDLLLTIPENSFTHLIVDQTNPVGAVHVGLPLHIHLPHPDEVTVDPNEISDPVWLTVEELKANVQEYENWSQILISQL